MRMWLVDPETMCKKHLLGEHLEMHMYVGALRRRTSVKGYLDNNLLELPTLYYRHEELVEELLRRGYKHSSPMDPDEVDVLIQRLPEAYLEVEMDREAAARELYRRCPDCKVKYEEKKRRESHGN